MPIAPRWTSRASPQLVAQRRPESGNSSRCKSTLYLAPLIEQNGQQCEVDDLQRRLRCSQCGAYNHAGQYYETDPNAFPVGSAGWWEMKRLEGGGRVR
jgi:hypothetical protein